MKATSAEQVIELATKHLSRGIMSMKHVFSYEFGGRTYYRAVIVGTNDTCHFSISEKTAHDLADNYNFFHENLK